MPPMRIPAPEKDEHLRSTVAIDTYARQHKITPREVRRLLGTGKLPFVQVRGQIRVQLDRPVDDEVEG